MNAGGGWENTINITATMGFCSIVQTAFCDDITAGVPGQLDTHPHGFIGGGQIGYNSQLAPAWVVGIEADFQGTNIKGDAARTVRHLWYGNEHGYRQPKD